MQGFWLADLLASYMYKYSDLCNCVSEQRKLWIKSKTCSNKEPCNVHLIDCHRLTALFLPIFMLISVTVTNVICNIYKLERPLRHYNLCTCTMVYIPEWPRLVSGPGSLQWTPQSHQELQESKTRTVSHGDCPQTRLLHLFHCDERMPRERCWQQSLLTAPEQKPHNTRSVHPSLF